VSFARDNRMVLLTPPGAGAIAVIRIIGPMVEQFLARHFSRRVTPMRCIHGDLRDHDGSVIDDIVVVMLGESQTADLNLHGGPWVIESAQKLLRSFGFDDGAIIDGVDGDDIIEREMLASLPLAKTQSGIRMLLAQPALGRSGLRPDPNDVTLWRLLNPARVAIVGIPNVGKSTLANQLFGQPRSITADLPGTTRDWVGELADVDGVPVVLVDTPGVRESDDHIERAAIELSSGVIQSADLVIIVLDPTQPTEKQAALAARWPDSIRVLNKADCTDDRPAALLNIKCGVQTVATTGAGLTDLRRLILERLGVIDHQSPRAHWWTQRQRDELTCP
jgi:tRNA modification GTPase